MAKAPKTPEEKAAFQAKMAEAKAKKQAAKLAAGEPVVVGKDSKKPKPATKPAEGKEGETPVKGSFADEFLL